MRLLITGVFVFIIGFASGQQSNESQPKYEYGVALSVGKLELNSSYFNTTFQYLNVGSELSIVKTISRRVKLMYGFTINKLIYISGPTTRQYLPSHCYGGECSGYGIEKPMYYQKEVYFYGLKFGVIHSVFNRGKFQSYAMSNIQTFYNSDLEIYQTISPFVYTYLNGGLGATYKIAKNVRMGINLEAGLNPGSFFGEKMFRPRMINYQSNLSFLFQL